MVTMIIPATATIATITIFQIRLKVKGSFTGILWKEVLSKGNLNNAYEKIAYRKKNLLMLPSGAARGKGMSKKPHVS